MTPWDSIKFIQEQFNHYPLSVDTESGGIGTSRPMCLVFMNNLVVRGTGSLGKAPSKSSTPPIKYLAGAKLRLLAVGVSQAGNT